MKTLNLSVFGAPSQGKSTFAAKLFYGMKVAGINCELVTEYAKDLTWKGHYNVLALQPYITAKQLSRVYHLQGKVQVAVTDSPILLGSIYRGFGCTPSFDDWLFETYSLFDNYNILLERQVVYKEEGRYQNEEEAKEIGTAIRELLHKRNIPYKLIPDYNEKWYEEIIEDIKDLVSEANSTKNK